METIALLMFAVVFLFLLSGYPVALVLAGVSLFFAFGGILLGHFDPSDLGFLPNRMFGIMTNEVLIAVPLFILMGVTLEKTNIARDLLETMSRLVGKLPGGLGLAVVLVGMLMAASTGIVGATVITLALLSLPLMIKQGYDHGFAAGTIAATGTLGQIIPPSIALVLIGDVLTNAYQQAQLQQGIFAPQTVSVGDLFAGALLPGLLLVILYAGYVWLRSFLFPNQAPVSPSRETTMNVELLFGLVPPIVLIVAVLGSILIGLATPTEASGVGAVGALLLALSYRTLNKTVLQEIALSTLKTTSMVFFILIGASFFALVFRGFGGDELIHHFIANLPGGGLTAMFIVMLVIFLLGFVLDFIEITYVVIPIVGPALLATGIDPVWLGVMIAVNLQTSFLTPPFGFALFYLRGVAPSIVQTRDIYRGVIPFVALQLLVLILLALVPQIATWLPGLR